MKAYLPLQASHFIRTVMGRVTHHPPPSGQPMAPAQSTASVQPAEPELAYIKRRINIEEPSFEHFQQIPMETLTTSILLFAHLVMENPSTPSGSDSLVVSKLTHYK